MNLKDFIKELQQMTEGVNRPEKVGVQMADTIPVVRPIFKIEFF